MTCRYDKFGDFLLERTDDTFVICFSEVESICYCSLPDSAYKYNAWWSNSHTHPLMKVVLDVGWTSSELDLQNKMIRFSRGKIPSKKMTASKNSDMPNGKKPFRHHTPASNWQKFENMARNAIEGEIGCILNGGKISITGKIKRFDLLNADKRIVGDIKHYSMTAGGNNPSAKFSTLNEYAWLMQRLEQYQKQKWRKIFVIGEDPTVVKIYASTYGAWLDDIEIYFCDAKGRLARHK